MPGEGVGVVLLKRLSRAVADGDRIHAVIRATSINHGGKTNGYTVPNPMAQRELIESALKKAHLDPRAHGPPGAVGVLGLRGVRRSARGREQAGRGSPGEAEQGMSITPLSIARG